MHALLNLFTISRNRLKAETVFYFSTAQRASQLASQPSYSRERERERERGEWGSSSSSGVCGSKLGLVVHHSGVGSNCSKCSRASSKREREREREEKRERERKERERERGREGDFSGHYTM
jgi:hypothetical protein